MKRAYRLLLPDRRDGYAYWVQVDSRRQVCRIQEAALKAALEGFAK